MKHNRKSIHKKSIIFIKSFFIVLSLFLLTFMIPTKICLSALPSNNNKEYYIVNSGTKHIIGDNGGMYNDNIRRELFVPTYIWDSKVYSAVFKPLSRDIWMGMDTLFIIYGKATIEEGVDEHGKVLKYSIDVNDWDIYGRIVTNNKFRTLFPKNYLTIYDYYWFDYFRDYLFYYYDGHVANF